MSTTSDVGGLAKFQDRLSKVCARLASPHGGERAAAALLAGEMLEQYGIRWESLAEAGIKTIFNEKFNSVQKQKPSQFGHASFCEELLIDYADKLSDWDVEFLSTIIKTYRNRRLSVKQQQCLDRIVKKCIPQNNK